MRLEHLLSGEDAHDQGSNEHGMRSVSRASCTSALFIIENSEKLSEELKLLGQSYSSVG